jgi:drug/metabolite transporter (DMT)-like permease
LALYVMPVAATLLGALFLGESITAPMTVGSTLVLAGVFLFTRR